MIIVCCTLQVGDDQITLFCKCNFFFSETRVSTCPGYQVSLVSCLGIRSVPDFCRHRCPRPRQRYRYQQETTVESILTWQVCFTELGVCLHVPPPCACPSKLHCVNVDGLSDRENGFFTQSARQTVRVNRPLMKGKIDMCISKNIGAIQPVLNTLLRIHTWSSGKICNCYGRKLNLFQSPLL